jgi:hypothetical protein
MADYLPRKYLLRYTALFAKQFLACLLTVAWKLRAPGYYSLDCVAEELALRAIVLRARDLLIEEGKGAHFDDFEDCAFEDVDFEELFSAAMDGVEDSDFGRATGMVDLHFKDWFKPSRSMNPVHPYVENRDGSKHANMDRDSTNGADYSVDTEPARQASRLMDLKGLGKEIWQGEDAQDYINRLRDEWER